MHTSLAGTGGRPMLISIGSNRLFGYEVGLVGCVGSVKSICWWVSSSSCMYWSWLLVGRWSIAVVEER